ncbi:hypothetical protein HPB49_010455 [Dermacentor silvarum]|uniref:Uncharacterized protein n=1 Tax=Dermacentor silvarum TaxID=543639 RepID=A0ACB8CKG2_DERSI|nr:hypothetical protein HPB49_010455 [Dermacentor silvarum]
MTPDSNRCERIRSLATFLREHGDVVLNGTRRLTLTTLCLNELNYIFRQFLGAQENESFDVPFGCGANSDFVYDVFFLHDFMQKTCSLKIVQSSQTIQGSLDLSKFHSLKILELKRVPPHLLVGFDCLVLQVETLICQRNISSLKEILRSRNKVPQPWVKIKVANFSYNGIAVLDDSLCSFADARLSRPPSKQPSAAPSFEVPEVNFSYTSGTTQTTERESTPLDKPSSASESPPEAMEVTLGSLVSLALRESP